MLEAKEYNAKLIYRYRKDNVPHLQFIHAIIEDDIKERYLHHIEIMTQTVLDALKSEMQLLTDIYKLNEDNWYSPDFNPYTKISDVYSGFLTPIHCMQNTIQHLFPATPQKIFVEFYSYKRSYSGL